MAVVLGLGETPAPRVEVSGIGLAQRVGELIADLTVQAALVAFDAEDVAAALFNDFAGDGALGSHGVDCDQRALEIEHFEQFGNGGDLVALLADEGLGEGIQASGDGRERTRPACRAAKPSNAGLAGLGAHGVQMVRFAAAAAAQGLAVDGDLAALHLEAEPPEVHGDACGERARLDGLEDACPALYTFYTFSVFVPWGPRSWRPPCNNSWALVPHDAFYFSS